MRGDVCIKEGLKVGNGDWIQASTYAGGNKSHSSGLITCLKLGEHWEYWFSLDDLRKIIQP